MKTFSRILNTLAVPTLTLALNLSPLFISGTYADSQVDGDSQSYQHNYQDNKGTSPAQNGRVQKLIKALNNSLISILDVLEPTDSHTAQVSYLKADFCFATYIENCKLHGYEVRASTPIKRGYAFTSIGQLESIHNNDMGEKDLEILFAEIGLGTKQSLTPSLSLFEEIAYYTAGEHEDGQTNSNDGLKIKIFGEKSINSKVTLGFGGTRDKTQNSGDYRDHNLLDQKPMMYFTTGEAYAEWRSTRELSFRIGASKMIDRPSDRRSAVNDPDYDHTYPNGDFILNMKYRFQA